MAHRPTPTAPVRLPSPAPDRERPTVTPDDDHPWKSPTLAQRGNGSRPRPNDKYPGEATMYRLYVEERKTLPEIAAVLGVNPQSAKKYLARADIPARQGANAHKRPAEEDAPAAHLADPTPFPTPGKRGRGKAGPVRPFLRLGETERRVVARAVDGFLLWLETSKERAA